MGSSLSAEIVRLDPPITEEANLMKTCCQLTKVEMQYLDGQFKALASVSAHNDITKSEWKREFRKLQSSDKRYIEELYFIFDVHNRGTISYTEWGTYVALLARNNDSKRVKYAFNVFDTDNSGYLDKEEFILMCLAVARVIVRCNVALPGIYRFDQENWKPLSRSDNEKITMEARKLFEKLDSDNSGHVDWHEFVAGTTENRTVQKVMTFFREVATPIPNDRAHLRHYNKIMPAPDAKEVAQLRKRKRSHRHTKWKDLHFDDAVIEYAEDGDLDSSSEDGDTLSSGSGGYRSKRRRARRGKSSKKSSKKSSRRHRDHHRELQYPPAYPPMMGGYGQYSSVIPGTAYPGQVYVPGQSAYQQPSSMSQPYGYGAGAPPVSYAPQPYGAPYGGAPLYQAPVSAVYVESTAATQPQGSGFQGY